MQQVSKQFSSLVKACFWEKLLLVSGECTESLKTNLAKHLFQHHVEIIDFEPWGPFEACQVDLDTLKIIADSGCVLREIEIPLFGDIEFDYPAPLPSAYEAQLSSIALGARLESFHASGVEGSALLTALAICPLRTLSLCYLTGTLEVGTAILVGRTSNARASLQNLSFGNCHFLSEPAVSSIGDLPNLTKLTLSDCSLTPLGLRQLSRATSLVDVDFGGYHGEPDDSELLARSLRSFCHASIRKFNAIQHDWFTDLELAAIAIGCPLLRDVSISSTEVTGFGCEEVLHKCQYLERLDVSQCRHVRNISAVIVECARALRFLDITRTSIPRGIAENLQMSLPSVEVQHSRVDH